MNILWHLNLSENPSLTILTSQLSRRLMIGISFIQRHYSSIVPLRPHLLSVLTRRTHYQI